MPPIFVTEDDADVRVSIAEILREEGYEVREFGSAEETLRELRAGARPCVVLVDLLLPGMSGEELVDAMRGDPDLASTAVVMITGARTAMSGVEILRKPFDMTELVAVIVNHCGRSGVR